LVRLAVACRKRKSVTDLSFIGSIRWMRRVYCAIVPPLGSLFCRGRDDYSEAIWRDDAPTRGSLACTGHWRGGFGVAWGGALSSRRPQGA